tara:strand:- start:114 stop:542 length:429 start_codon:yes stop_codon:yes gene_type:complete
LLDDFFATLKMSSVVTSFGGDLDIQGGQLGLSCELNIGATTDLYSTFKASHYVLNPTAANVIINLPEIGSAVHSAQTGVQEGNRLSIMNVSASNSLRVFNNDGSTEYSSLAPGDTATYHASLTYEWIVSRNGGNDGDFANGL